MRASILSICFAVVTISTISTAFAEVSSDQREACMPDVFRLCSKHIPNAGAITACLRQEKARLSPACRSVFNGKSKSVARAGE